MTTHAYLWGPHWDPGTQRRVNQVGARCKKCGREEYHSAPGPGWGRRIFKKQGWHLGSTQNNHTCPKCVAKTRAPPKTSEVTVLHPQTDAVSMPPIRPEAMSGTAIITQARHIDTPQEAPTALAEGLAPLKQKLEIKARRIVARGMPNGFSQRSSAAAAARRFIADKLGVRAPREDIHYRTVKDPDGTYSYVLVAMNLPTPPPEASKPVEVKPKATPTAKKRAYYGGGRAPFPPNKMRGLDVGRRKMAASAQSYLRRVFNVADAQEGVDFRVLEYASGLVYELIGREPPRDLTPLGSGGVIAGDVLRPRARKGKRRMSVATRMERVVKPNEPRPTNPSNLRASAIRYLLLTGIADPKIGVHFEVYQPTPDTYAYRLLDAPVTPVAKTPKYAKNQDPDHNRRRALSRVAKPGQIINANGRNRKWNAARSAKLYLKLAFGVSDAQEGVDFRVFGNPRDGYSYEEIEQSTPDTQIANPQPQQETPAVSDGSTQGVRDAEEQAAQPPKPLGREATYPDKRTIRAALDEMYDEDAGHYRGEWDDKSLAEKLKMPRIWVTQVRETYGPDKNDAERLRQEAALLASRVKLTRLNTLVDEAKKIADAVLELAAKLNDKMSDVEALKKELGL